MDKLIISVFYDVDNFCKELNSYFQHYFLSHDGKNISFEVPASLSLSKIMTICIAFHLFGYRTFKGYYINFIMKYYIGYFPKLVSYNRFVELMRYAALPMALFAKFSSSKNSCTGISFVDSATLVVCDSHKIHHHKVFHKTDKRGKSSTGWFYGFKLHLVINERGKILNFRLTPGNIDDRNEEVMEVLTKNLFGKVFADKGYISQKLFEMMRYSDRLLLRKRAVIESVND